MCCKGTIEDDPRALCHTQFNDERTSAQRVFNNIKPVISRIARGEEFLEMSALIIIEVQMFSPDSKQTTNRAAITMHNSFEINWVNILLS